MAISQETNNQIQNKQVGKNTRNLVIAVLMITIVSMSFGAIVGSYITISSVNKSFQLGEVHLCNAVELNYSEEMYKLQQYKNDLQSSCSIKTLDGIDKINIS